MSEKILAALRAAEWVPVYQEGFASMRCPACGELRPSAPTRSEARFGINQTSGHKSGCIVAAAIREAELAQRPFDMEAARQFLTHEVRAGTLKSFEVHADGRCDMVPAALGSIQFHYIKGSIALVPATEQTREERDSEVDRAFDLVDVEAEAWRLAQLAATIAMGRFQNGVNVGWCVDRATKIMAAARAKVREQR